MEKTNLNNKIHKQKDMKVCEICGRQTDRTYKTYLEGSKIEVCYDCLMRHNLKPIESPNIVIKRNKFEVKDEEKNFDIVDNYGEIIRQTRDKMKLTQEEMAKKLGISLIKYRQIEHETIVPEKDLIEKIEKILKIKLQIDKNDEDGEDDMEIIASTNTNEFTLGDIVEIRKRK